MRITIATINTVSLPMSSPLALRNSAFHPIHSRSYSLDRPGISLRNVAGSQVLSINLLGANVNEFEKRGIVEGQAFGQFHDGIARVLPLGFAQFQQHMAEQGRE